MLTEQAQSNAYKYNCDYCYFKCSKQSEWARHITTNKHNTLVNTAKKRQKTPNDNTYECLCGNEYKHRQSLFTHKKTCHVIQNNSPANSDQQNDVLSNAIITLINQNNELRNIIIEQNQNHMNSYVDISKHITTELINAVKSGQLGNTNNSNNILTNNNSNNTTFNLQFFLNETCKDAINIDEFINNIKITNADLEETARLGYSGGISRIVMNELNSMEVTKKPIHCSDVKRETIYIKENNTWQKDDDTKTKLVSAIKQIARKNYMHILEWAKDNPSHKDYDSKVGKLYNKIITNSMNGINEAEQTDNIKKIVKTIIKSSAIDKQLLV